MIKIVSVKRLFPFLVWIGAVNRASLIADLWAALTSSILVLPQAIAFAAIAGMPIEYGFYTAIVTPIIAALFGSSRQMVSGPTTAISVLLFASLAQQFNPESPPYIQMVISVTLVAGFFQMLLGALRLGTLSSFVSPSVMVGFTASAAIIIGYSQVSGILGLSWEQMKSSVMDDSFYSIISQIHVVYSVLIAATSFVTALLISKFYPKIPFYLIALFIGSILAYLISAGDVGTAFVGMEEISAKSPLAFMPSFAT